MHNLMSRLYLPEEIGIETKGNFFAMSFVEYIKRRIE